ncbi:hypothetical protein R6Q59_030318 [Mikania micrantha]
MDVTTKNHRQTAEEEVDVKYTVAGMVAIHSQVRKIKQEFEKTMHPAAIEQPEIRSVIREFSRLQKRSRSPLGIINRPISIGVCYYNLGTVNRLLGLWAKLCNVCDGTNTSPLYSAVVKDHLDVVNAILDADVSCIGIIVSLLLSFTSISVNAINHQQETAMDIADKLNYGPPKLEIMEA